MTLDLGDALRTFMTESRELLDAMEEALLRVEQAPGDDELVHSIFRAAHTIKGSAGIFGLDDIVAFTHVAESVLDRVRQGGLRFDGALASLFLSAGDHLRELLDDLSGRAVGPERASRGADLTARLCLASMSRSR